MRRHGIARRAAGDAEQEHRRSELRAEGPPGRSLQDGGDHVGAHGWQTGVFAVHESRRKLSGEYHKQAIHLVDAVDQ